MVGVYRIHEAGGPEVMRWEEEDLGALGSGMAEVRHTAIGLNYIDTYHRSGLYRMPLPTRLGVEGAGVVEAIGEGVEGVAVGDRVAYSGGLGAYAEAIHMPANRLVKLPEGINEETAAASLLKGLTAAYLLTRTFEVERGHNVLIHAAAGGTGLILCQWAHHLGANVIGTAGSEEKAAMARENGADHTILYRNEDVAERVRALTDGRGVNVVYDGVGKDTFDASLNSLAPLGMFVSFGNASGNAPSVAPHDLQNRGSLFFTRPSLAHYSASSDDLQSLADRFFEVVESGAVKIHINQRYPLSDLVQAHRDLESRVTTGSTIIVP
jgi:NADPH2:quinone reductase